MGFRQAERKRAYLKLAVMGPSGSGKTYGALQLAKGLAGTGKIAVVDTENGSSELYAGMAGMPAFDILPLSPPFVSRKYLEAIREAVEQGYAVIVLDSISHEWAGDGSILSRKEQVDARGGNSFTNWASFTKEHNEFIAAISNAPIHIDATMRSKQDYII